MLDLETADRMIRGYSFTEQAFREALELDHSDPLPVAPQSLHRNSYDGNICVVSPFAPRSQSDDWNGRIRVRFGMERALGAWIAEHRPHLLEVWDAALVRSAMLFLVPRLKTNEADE